MENPHDKKEPERGEDAGDTARDSAERVLSASVFALSSSDDRVDLLRMASSSYTRSATAIGADGTLEFPPLFGDSDVDAASLRRRSTTPRGVLGEIGRETPAPRPGRETDIVASRRSLTDLARRSMKPEEHSRLQEKMRAFETRALARGLDHLEITQTYKHVARLLEAKGETPLSREQRHRVALQVMENAADPTDIPQGLTNNTCNVTTIESVVYTINPSHAARLVADVAISGRYRGPGGQEVEIDPKPRTHAAEHGADRAAGQRVHASEIFQITAANLYHKSTGSNLRYDQVNGVEKLFDGPNVIDDYTGVRGGAIVETARLITGHDRIRMIHSGSYGAAHPLLDKISSAPELEQYLSRAKLEGRLPLIVRVNASLEPIGSYGADLHPPELRASGMHVVTVTDYHPGRPPSVSMDNQWTRADDFLGERKLSLADLWKAMQSNSAALRIVQSEADARRAAGVFDPSREAELLRLHSSSTDRVATWSSTLPDTPAGARGLAAYLASEGILDHYQLEAAFDDTWMRYVAHCNRITTCNSEDRRVIDAMIAGPLTAHENTLRRLKLIHDYKLLPAPVMEVAIGRLLSAWERSTHSNRAVNITAVKDYINTLPPDQQRRIHAAAAS